MSNTITIATLKQGAQSLGLEMPAKPTKKELEAAITEKLSEQQLGYECPECGKDIPDIDICPYCSANFADDGGETQDEEQGESGLGAEDSIDAISGEIDNNGSMEDDKTEPKDEKETIKADAPENKDSNPKPNAKAETKVKSKSGKDSEEYQVLIAQIDTILSGESITKKDNVSGITYLVDKKRLMKVAATAKSISIELNEELDTDDDNVRKYSEADAKAKHLGTVRAIYSFGDLETALSLVRQAYEIRMGKAVVEAK